MTVQLFCGDCLEIMPAIADKSVDAIITDLPFGITACKWDSVIPFEPMWEQLKRITKKNGAIVLFGSQPFTSALVMSNPKMFKYEWIFHKSLPVGHGYAKFRPMSNHENICVFGNGRVIYNPQLIKREKPRSYTRKSASLSGASSMTSHDGAERILVSKHPTTIQTFNTSVQKGKVHPTQKPVALIEYLIKTYTNEGETVLDFTAGSGTTGVAAINTNRNAILIEQEPEYCEIIKRRIDEAERRKNNESFVKKPTEPTLFDFMLEDEQ